MKVNSYDLVLGPTANEARLVLTLVGECPVCSTPHSRSWETSLSQLALRPMGSSVPHRLLSDLSYIAQAISPGSNYRFACDTCGVVQSIVAHGLYDHLRDRTWGKLAPHADDLMMRPASFIGRAIVGPDEWQAVDVQGVRLNPPNRLVLLWGTISDEWEQPAESAPRPQISAAVPDGLTTSPLEGAAAESEEAVDE